MVTTRRRTAPDDKPARVSAQRGSSSALNPNAGDHAVTSDPHELAAVRNAAERSWSRHAYYQARYGNRGFKFALSDGAWIVTLADHDGREAAASLRWLGRMLSSRGMPQFLLRCAIEDLYVELVNTIPERKAQYAFLKRAAARIRHASEKILAREDFERMAASFDGPAGEERSAFPRFGEIIVAAVIDEALGIDHAVSSVVRWATDETRFSHAWTAAVIQTIAQTRIAIGGRGARVKKAARHRTRP